VIGLLGFLPVALVVMCFALYKLWRDGSRARSPRERHAVATTGCRLGVASSLMLAVAGLGCLQGPAWMIGWLMILLGLGGAITGYVVIRIHLTQCAPTSSMQQAEGRPLR
jgi:hypothetical protein